jgi:hypothetical protein
LLAKTIEKTDRGSSWGQPTKIGDQSYSFQDSLIKASTLDPSHPEPYRLLAKPGHSVTIHGVSLSQQELLLTATIAHLAKDPSNIHYEKIADLCPDNEPIYIPHIGKTNRQNLYISALDRNPQECSLYFKLANSITSRHSKVTIKEKMFDKESLQAKGFELQADARLRT